MAVSPVSNVDDDDEIMVNNQNNNAIPECEQSSDNASEMSGDTRVLTEDADPRSIPVISPGQYVAYVHSVIKLLVGSHQLTQWTEKGKAVQVGPTATTFAPYCIFMNILY